MSGYKDQGMRYGISALSTDYHEVCEPDELMVRQTDGRMYYKRDDGHIVTAPREYNRRDLMSDLVATGIKLDFNTTKYICYNTLDIAGKTNLYSPETFDLGTKSVAFPVDDGHNGICIRIHGTDMVGAVSTHIRTLYDCWSGSARNKDPEVLVTLEVNGEDIQVGCKFDQLNLLDLGVDGPAVCYIKSVSFPRMVAQFNYLSDHRKANLARLNMDNPIYEASYIDVVTVTTDVSTVPVYALSGKAVLRMMFPTEVVVEENVTLGDGGGVTLSPEQPAYPGIWAKPREIKE